MLESKVVHIGPTVSRNPHQGNVREFAVELQQEDFQGPPEFGMISFM
jgi:hypothetical protein